MNTKSKHNNIETKKLNYEIREVVFREILEAEINAQKMSEIDFKRLTANIKKDGCLTSFPLLWEDEEKKVHCISGHHRIRAAIKAGLTKGHCIVLTDIEESTRIRLQLSHNDIHGEPDKDIVALLLNKLNGIDITLVDTTEIMAAEKQIKELNIDIPNFQYINLCLVEQSRKDLVDMILSLEKSDAINWLVSKEEYADIKDLLTYAFEHNFKTPGQAFGKFLDIIKENKHLIERL